MLLPNPLDFPLPFIGLCTLAQKFISAAVFLARIVLHKNLPIAQSMHLRLNFYPAASGAELQDGRADRVPRL
jgi:hypothetical protein